MSIIPVKCHGCGAVGPVKLSVLARVGIDGELRCKCGSADLDVDEGATTATRHTAVDEYDLQVEHAIGLHRSFPDPHCPACQGSPVEGPIESAPSVTRPPRGEVSHLGARTAAGGDQWFVLEHGQIRLGPVSEDEARSFYERMLEALKPEARHILELYRGTKVAARHAATTYVPRPSGHVVPMNEGDTLTTEDEFTRIRFTNDVFVPELRLPGSGQWMSTGRGFDIFAEAEDFANEVWEGWNKEGSAHTAAIRQEVSPGGVPVEVHIAIGLPGFDVVNWPQGSVRALRDAVAELVEIPQRRITVNFPTQGLRMTDELIADVAPVIADVIRLIGTPQTTARLGSLGETFHVAELDQRTSATQPGYYAANEAPEQKEAAGYAPTYYVMVEEADGLFFWDVFRSPRDPLGIASGISTTLGQVRYDASSSIGHSHELVPHPGSSISINASRSTGPKAKRAEIVAAILRTNPGLDRRIATQVAEATLKRRG